MNDWEMGDHLPFAFETAWKDSVLGSSNLYFDYYVMFKSMAQDLMQPVAATGKLVQEVHSLTETKQCKKTRNVGTEFRRWSMRLKKVTMERGRYAWMKSAGWKRGRFAVLQGGQRDARDEGIKDLGHTKWVEAIM
jgi:hypothetical protein